MYQPPQNNGRARRNPVILPVIPGTRVPAPFPVPADPVGDADPAFLALLYAGDAQGLVEAVKAAGDDTPSASLGLTRTAVRRGLEEAAVFLLSRHAEKHQDSFRMEKALLMREGVMSGKLKVVQKLVELGARTGDDALWPLAALSDNPGILRAVTENSRTSKRTDIVSAFNAASAAGKKNTADYLLENYAISLRAPELLQACDHALRGGHKDMALDYTKRIDDMTTGIDKIRSILMSMALNHDAPAVFDVALAGHRSSFEGPLRHAILAGKADYAEKIITEARTKDLLTQGDLDMALTVAASARKHDIAFLMLDHGADISTQDDYAVREAVKKEEAEFALKLILRGADARKALGQALAAWPENKALQDDIRQAANSFATSETKRLFDVLNGDFSAKNLLEKRPELNNLSPLRHAALVRILPAVLQHTDPNDIRAALFLSKEDGRETILSLAARRNRLGDILDPALWTGKVDETAPLFAALSPEHRKQVNADSFLLKTRQKTLRKGSRGKFNL